VALNVQVDYVTPGAKKAIEAAGGQVTLVHAKA
jgi:ribosomal protein L15